MAKFKLGDRVRALTSEYAPEGTEGAVCQGFSLMCIAEGMRAAEQENKDTVGLWKQSSLN